jgi:hypothetical protein
MATPLPPAQYAPPPPTLYVMVGHCAYVSATQKEKNGKSNIGTLKRFNSKNNPANDPGISCRKQSPEHAERKRVKVFFIARN